LPPLIVRHFTVERGVVALQRVPRLENLAFDARGDTFNATATLAHGGSMRTQGQVSLGPLDVKGELELTHGSLAELWPYLPADSGEAPAGEIGGSIEYRYAGGKLALSGAKLRAGYDPQADLQALKPREPRYGERLLAALAAKTDVPADAVSSLAARRAQAAADGVATALALQAR
jgi:hypothetical protein